MKKALIILILIIAGVSLNAQTYHFAKFSIDMFENSADNEEGHSIVISDTTINVVLDNVILDTTQAVHFGEQFQNNYRIIHKFEVVVNGKRQISYVVQDSDVNEHNYLDHTYNIDFQKEAITIQSLNINEPQRFYFSN